MLRLVTKEEFWAGIDAGLLHVPDWSNLSIKQTQDAVLLSHLSAAEGLDIFEVGGGNSRTLPVLCRHNRGVNVDPVEGSGHGPIGIDQGAVPWRHVFRKVGETADVLPDESADIIYSISVLEHVIFDGDIASAVSDMVRLLRPGGSMIHLVDAYVADQGQENSFALKIARALRNALSHPSLEPAGEVLRDEEIYFKGEYATNPDYIMHHWNKSAPQWRALRARAQACSFIMKATKAESRQAGR